MVFGILWCIWLEKNARIFQSASMPLDLLWDRIRFLAFLWGSANWCFKVVSVTDIVNGLPLLTAILEGTWGVFCYFCFSCFLFFFGG